MHIGCFEHFGMDRLVGFHDCIDCIKLYEAKSEESGRIGFGIRLMGRNLYDNGRIDKKEN